MFLLQLVDGKLSPIRGTCEKTLIRQIHGFFHITDLDFFRSPEHLKWADILIGDGHFSRRWDDQLSVSVPTALRAANKSWDMISNGIRLDVWHNGHLDGKTKWRGGGYRAWWKKESQEKFPEAVPICKNYIRSGG